MGSGTTRLREERTNRYGSRGSFISRAMRWRSRFAREGATKIHQLTKTEPINANTPSSNCQLVFMTERCYPPHFSEASVRTIGYATEQFANGLALEGAQKLTHMSMNRSSLECTRYSVTVPIPW
jgi:hypothetical protein